MYLNVYNITLNILKNTKDQEPKFIKDCRQRNKWQKWKDTFKA